MSYKIINGQLVADGDPLLIEKVNCSHAAVTTIPNTLVNLRQFYCSCTQIKEIPSSLTKLIKLSCPDTQIVSIPSTLTNLRELYCHNTQIKEIPSTLVNLKELYCSHTQIKEIPSSLTKLERLYCWNTKIKEIPSSLTNMMQLYCYDTQIKEIPYSLMLPWMQLKCKQKHKVKIFDRYVLDPRKPGSEEVCGQKRCYELPTRKQEQRKFKSFCRKVKYCQVLIETILHPLEHKVL